jgi:hypothetical protein
MNLKDINPVASSHKMNTLMNSRFGFGIDFSRLSYGKALNLSNTISENLNRIRHSYGVHTAERNPKYMELLMVREGLNAWLGENRNLMEGELGKSEAILAAKDIVDSLQDMVEKISKMQVEQLPALIDTIRDQMGAPNADQFKNSMGQLLTDLAGTLSQARETADNSARQLAGEEVGGGMGMGGMGGGMPLPGGPSAMPGSDMDMDSIDTFAASDAASGGTEPVGREKR